MRLLHFGLAFALAMAAFADTVTLRDGRVLNGNYLGGTPRQVRLDMGDRVETLDIGDIVRIEFGEPAAAPTAAPAPAPNGDQDRDPDRPIMRRRDDSAVMQPDSEAAPPPAQAAVGPIQLPQGTNIVIRMIDGVDSETNKVGDTFAASLDDAVIIDNQTVIPRGANATVKLVDAKESGKFTGRAEVALSLQFVRVNERSVELNTQTVSRVSDPRGPRTAKVAGGTAAVGAIIGALAGGGKGAAVGAAAGGAVGAGAQAMTKGQRVKIPSETRLTFVLDNAVSI
jgi:hypothetical protein